QPASRARGQGADAPAGLRRAGRPRRRAARGPGNGERDYRRRSDGRRRAGRRRGAGSRGGFGAMSGRYRLVDFLGFTPVSHPIWQPASRARGQGADAPAGLRRAGRPRRRAARGPGNGERDYRRRSDGRRRAGRRRGAGSRGGFGAMSGRYRLVDFLGFTPVSHRPPLPKRWWVYCGVAFLAPSLVLQLVPATEVPYRDLVWLLTLVPAYLLSLHYGLRGAVAGLVMGTVLFTSIQFLVALNLEPEDWRITVPIYVSYGVIAIS